MVLGYVFSAPFFALTVRTSQKHGQKRSLMTYVAVAFICYIGVLVMLLLWKFGNPAWNLSVYEGTLFKSDFKITINLYTVLFVLFFGVGYGAYYSTADMPIPMVADCADYETYKSGKFIPGIMGTMFSLVDKLVSSLSGTIVGLAVGFIGFSNLPTKATAYAEGMHWVVIVLFCLIPMASWIATLVAMKGYSLTGEKMKTINKVNAARRAAITAGMPADEAMKTITDETAQ
jgi:Na+/melibiose symporter-like transporter